MSIALTSYPVVNENGLIRNIFAGFDSVNIEFQRMDFDGVSIGSGANNKIEVTVPTISLLNDVKVGEWVYLYAEGGSYTYNDSFKVLAISRPASDTIILLDGDFIQTAVDGWINYKQDYSLQIKLVSPTNTDVSIYKAILSDNGKPNGQIKIGVTPPVDGLAQEIFSGSRELSNGRIKFKVMYREYYRNNTSDSFQLVDETPIIIIYAAENSNMESFINGFDMPRIWLGYPFAINLLHSDENFENKSINITFDELDINKDTITTGNLITNFGSTKYGCLQSDFNDRLIELNNNTKYIKFSATETESADYSATDYNSTDYYTINS